MAGSEAGSGDFDSLAVFRQVLLSFLSGFRWIMTTGAILLVLPAIASHILGDTLGGTATTLGQILVLVLAMQFLAIVSFGVLAALQGHKLPTTAVFDSGLPTSQPGLRVALVMGVVLMVGIILMTIAANHPLAWLVRAYVTWTLIGLLASWLPAIPAAIAEQLPPLMALRRAVQLTKGHRRRLFALLVVVGLALIPGVMLVSLVSFGPGVPPLGAWAAMDAMPLHRPGLWIYLLFKLLATGLLACVPPVVYAELTTAK